MTAPEGPLQSRVRVGWPALDGATTRAEAGCPAIWRVVPKDRVNMHTLGTRFRKGFGMEWDQIAENWAAMAKRLYGDRPAGAAHVSGTTSEPLVPTPLFQPETGPPTPMVQGNDLLDHKPRQ